MGDGPTGVEKHIKSIINIASIYNIETTIVTPKDANYFVRKIPNLMYRIIKLFNKEIAYFFGNFIDGTRIKKNLRTIISANINREIIYYAQSSMCANMALQVRLKDQKVVIVSHFNLSEAHEVKEKGVTKKESWLWKHLMSIEKIGYKGADTIIFVSNFMSQVVNERLPDIKEIKQYVIPNFISLDDNNYKNNWDIRGDLLSIGSLEPRKNQEFLLRVLFECNKMGRYYSLCIVGIGPDLDKLKKITKKFGLIKQVKFLGFVPNASTLLKNFKLYVHAAKMESFGISIIEALGFGIPVLAAKVGGVGEIIVDKSCGLFWELDNPKKAAEMIIELIEDDEKMSKMSLQAISHYKNNFDYSINSKKWLNAIVS